MLGKLQGAKFNEKYRMASILPWKLRYMIVHGWWMIPGTPSKCPCWLKKLDIPGGEEETDSGREVDLFSSKKTFFSIVVLPL